MTALSRRRLLTTAGATIVAVGGATTLARTPALAIPPGFDKVLYWNRILLGAYRAAVGNPAASPTLLSRAGAMMHLAIYDAYNSFANIGAPYLAKYSRQGNFSYDLGQNVNWAAYRVLQSVFPTMSFTKALSDSNAYPPIGEPGPEGWSTSIGEDAAVAILNNRVNDGSTNTTPYTPSTAPGQWRPTGSGDAKTPNWGLVRPFSLSSGSQFRPPLPGGFATVTAMLQSAAYTAQFNEVRDLGRDISATRTQVQTDIAFFWACDLDGTYKPPGQLFYHTNQVSSARSLTEAQNAKLFALVAMAMADAAIAAWDAKYQTSIDLWRPETGIREAAGDGNASTAPITDWKPLSVMRDNVTRFSPNFPAYVSGHATFGAAWAGIMRRYFNSDSMPEVLTTEDPHAVGVTRAPGTFTAAARENGRSRIYLGVHWQWDADQGYNTGEAIANQVFNSRLR
ncbi:vanadium-dependent haloperoxidase [Asanoa iriomotensis]|uniref:Phosphatidic acid phosphatase type 2/haloperoxidase domain-containing protein n=1 Tax=Asanoa iriomotensis TaxID=234613 RepID=A0ABQ4C556_9ACTN|nr:vanadium-dependent haloperoxidase [Asanoa iriomotensis]GIF57919.1 hypothetical protein Air01nite_40140 [Asanoa iriomotensis]